MRYVTNKITALLKDHSVIRLVIRINHHKLKYCLLSPEDQDNESDNTVDNCHTCKNKGTNMKEWNIYTSEDNREIDTLNLQQRDSWE